jgi:26S proteasome regulatory subunit (ATPase 3-interacting protein)
MCEAGHISKGVHPSSPWPKKKLLPRLQRLFYSILQQRIALIQQVRVLPKCADPSADVSLNMGQSKTLTQKILVQLAASEAIDFKTYGKQQVYVIKQDNLDAPTAEEIAAVDEKIVDLEQGWNELREETKLLHQQVAQASNTMTTEKAIARVKVLTKENQHVKERLESLKTGTQLIPLEQRQQVDNQLKMYMQEWIRRHRLFKDAWNRVLEAVEGVKPKDLMDEIGIDTGTFTF